MADLPTPLPGQAPHDRFGFRTGDGQSTHAIYAMVALIKGGRSQPIEFVGTGFFITLNGIFLTAKHVLMDVLDENFNQTHPLGMVQFLPNDRVIIRSVTAMIGHKTADVAIGLPAVAHHKTTKQPLTNNVFPLSFTPPAVNDYVATYAFPKTRVLPGPTTKVHIEPRFFEGVVHTLYLNGRDRTLLPGACFETSMQIHRGASGGPVFGEAGVVFGLNSTGFDGSETGFVSLIDCIKDMTLENARYSEDEAPRRIPVVDLIRDGHVVMRDAAAHVTFRSQTGFEDAL